MIVGIDPGHASLVELIGQFMQACFAGFELICQFGGRPGIGIVDLANGSELFLRDSEIGAALV